MKAEQIEMKADIMLAGSLQRSLQAGTAKLAKKRKGIKDYCEKQATAPTEETPKTDKTKATKATKTPQPTIKLSDGEQQTVIDWAKQHYNNVADIKRCADELQIKAGQVYYTLKKHSFIEQKDTTEHRVLSAYYKHHGNLAKITEETGLGVWIVAKTVESFGYSPRWQDYKNSRYAIRAGNSGIAAEQKFKEFVPQAVDMNDDFRECNPAFDFQVGNHTVDVKEAAIVINKRSPSSKGYWTVRLGNPDDMADFYCLFLCYNKEKRIEGDYSLLLIPKEALPDIDRLQISANPETETNKFYFQFEIEPIALPYMLGVED